LSWVGPSGAHGSMYYVSPDKRSFWSEITFDPDMFRCILC
jgi:hypothetical protein